ncbi:hypothetical protein IHE55_14720 [Streptomyces pactum]|uniref:Peptidase n=1 Tax=Streptomyces pactum TaxID=68249 RepID=A0ABS0NLK2_9ACTN|nr:hypothetical protein [Streptomyces pactum]MBH5335974.1 hypothetical protein [Streptomyces pactum]
MNDRGAAGAGLVAAVALAVMAGFAGPVARAAPADDEREIAAYRPQGRPVQGTSTARDAPPLAPVGSYVDSIGAGETRHYRVELDADSTAYVSVVAVPPPGSPVTAFRDGVELSLRDSGGQLCDRSRPTAEAVGAVYPLAGYAVRLKRPGAADGCGRAGEYDFTVARDAGPGRTPGRSGTSGTSGAAGTGGADGSDGAARWPLELRFEQEPAVRGGPTAPPSPSGGRPTEPPPTPDAAGEQLGERAGGSDFRQAGALRPGVWTTRVAPGETRYFRVRLDWGQRLSASAALPAAGDPDSAAPDATSPGGGAAHRRPLGDAFGVTLYNPMRGPVRRSGFAPYAGDRAEDALEPTAPVAYGNRFARARPEVAAVSFAGEYYLAVTLHPDMARYFGRTVPVTLRIGVTGARQAGPEYVRDGSGDGFGLRRPATGAEDAGAADGPDGPLRAVAYAAFGTGTALLLGLAAWTVTARRRSGRPGG